MRFTEEEVTTFLCNSSDDRAAAFDGMSTTFLLPFEIL